MKQNLFQPFRLHPMRPPALELEQYQRAGAWWLARHKRAILADGLGLGKTATAIRASDLIQSKVTVVVAPLSLLSQWRQEILRFSQTNDTIWYVVNYERLTKPPYNAMKPDCLIVDEAVAVKNYRAARTKAFMDLSGRAECIFLLTGTPIRNHPADLAVPFLAIENSPQRPILRLDRAYWNWLTRYFIIQEISWPNGGRETRPVRVYPYLQGEFDELIDRYILRREKSIIQLPPFSTETVELDWEDEQLETYRLALEDMVLRHIDGEDESMAYKLAQLMRLQQIALDPALCNAVGGSAKNEYLEQFFEAYAPDHRILVFTKFRSWIEPARERYEAYNPLVLHGEMDRAEREEAIRQWHEDQSHRVFILSSGAGAVGLNLQEADVVVWADLPWTPDLLEQGTARAWRRGQTKPVHEILLTMRLSVDGHMLSVLRKKEGVANQTLAAAQVWKRMVEAMVGVEA